MDDNIDDQQPKAERLEQLSANRGTERTVNRGYSRFIKKVQIVLPVIALILIGLIVGWQNFEGDKIVPIEQEDTPPQMRQEIGKNELINPRFESMDEKGQPYVITADRAIQEDGDDSDMLLENPAGKMTLESGKTVTIRADNGNYKQLERFLDLQSNVVLKHSDGYNMQTSLLHVDLDENKAWSKTDVDVSGPEGTINAKGVTASSIEETIIFDGPAKMVLTLENGQGGLGDLLP